MQKGQCVTISGPYVKYNNLLSRLASLGRNVSSLGVRPPVPRMAARRVKMTSLAVCRRDDVIENMFSGLNVGRVDIRASTAETKRMFRAWVAAFGRG